MMLSKRDLVVLVADKNMKAAIQGLLARPQALGIRRLEFDIYVHPEKDAGCCTRSHEFLRPFIKQYSHGLILFDHQGCGHEDEPSVSLEAAVSRRLASAGWDDRASVVVLVPELESWVWSDSPHVSRHLGWPGTLTELRAWLVQHNQWNASDPKPHDPKAAVEAVCRHVHKPRSSAVYRALAEHVSFQRCTDPAFLRFRRILEGWFSV